MQLNKCYVVTFLLVQIVAGCGGGTVADTAAPTINSFTMPTTAKSSTVAVTALTAGDNIGVNAYLITEGLLKSIT